MTTLSHVLASTQHNLLQSLFIFTFRASLSRTTHTMKHIFMMFVRTRCHIDTFHVSQKLSSIFTYLPARARAFLCHLRIIQLDTGAELHVWDHKKITSLCAIMMSEEAKLGKINLLMYSSLSSRWTWKAEINCMRTIHSTVVFFCCTTETRSGIRNGIEKFSRKTNFWMASIKTLNCFHACKSRKLDMQCALTIRHSDQIACVIKNFRENRFLKSQEWGEARGALSSVIYAISTKKK